MKEEKENLSISVTASIFNLTVLFLLSLSLTGCSSNTEKKGNNASNSPAQVTLQCDRSPPIRTHNDTETGKVLEEGPIQLGNLTCDKANELPAKNLLNLSREGEWVRYYKGTDVIQMKGNYRDNKKEGEWSLYDKEGNLKQIVTFVNDEKMGVETTFFPGTDEWNSKGSYIQGKKEGVWQYRDAANSDCISSGNYKADKKGGQWKECSRSEKGDWYTGFNGLYSNGLKSGAAEHYFPDGSVSSSGNYSADAACLKNPPDDDESKCERKSGEWKSYHENGNLAARGNYSASTGKRIGSWTEYYQSGQKMAEGTREHVRNGTWQIWDKQGNLLYKFEFDHTEYAPASAHVYKNGQVVASGPVQFGMLKYNGKSDSIELVGLKEKGHWIIYNNTGSKIAEGDYLMGTKNGTWKELENGKWITRNYMMGKLSQ